MGAELTSAGEMPQVSAALAAGMTGRGVGAGVRSALWAAGKGLSAATRCGVSELVAF